MIENLALSLNRQIIFGRLHNYKIDIVKSMLEMCHALDGGFMLRVEFLAQRKTVQGLNFPVVHTVQQVYKRGVEQGVFRPNLDPLDLHMMMSALRF